MESDHVSQNIVQSGHAEVDTWRRGCGCVKTSDKLRQILKTFPSPPPPSLGTIPNYNLEETCISVYCNNTHQASPQVSEITNKSSDTIVNQEKDLLFQSNSTSWNVVSELVQLVQLSVTATALALYYLIYCYMQLVYYTLRSALYFHNADGPMKITIGVVTVTSLVVGVNLIIRMEKLFGFFY